VINTADSGSTFQSSSQRGTDCNEAPERRVIISPLSVLFSTRNRLQPGGKNLHPQRSEQRFQSSSQRGTDCNLVQLGGPRHNHLSVLFSTRNRLQPVCAPSRPRPKATFSPLLNEEQTATAAGAGKCSPCPAFSPLLNEEQTATPEEPATPALATSAFQSSSQRGTDCN